MTPQEFWSGWWWPAATALLGFVFAGLVFSQWLQRRKPHQLAWSVGLLMYAIAAVMEAASEGLGYWDPFVYRIYIVLAASLVGFLGLGTYYLMARKKERPTYVLVYLLVAFAIFLGGALLADLDESKLVPGITVGGQALGASMSFPRVMSFFFNIPGTLLLLGGAVVSAYRFSRKDEFAYRMWANILIAVGTIIIAGAGSMARAGQTVGLYPAEMLASAILLTGFLLAGTLEKGAREARKSAPPRKMEQPPEADAQ
jgi:uncharacterized membrane protein